MYKELKTRLIIDVHNMVVHSKQRIQDASKKLNLPSWWVESVIIEYFSCRRFAENSELSVFDFGIIDDKLLNSIKLKHVVIPHYRLIQNVSPRDLAYRLPKLVTGESRLPFDNIDLIPEGIVNKTAFPFIANPIDKWDPKLGFNEYAVIFDNGYFYQWKIAELYRINERSSWYKSNLFDLIPLWKVYEQLINCLSKDLENPQPELIWKIKNLYDQLEKVRRPLRIGIWKYHEQKKVHYDTAKANVPEPPLVSFFDSIRVSSSGYEIESHIEPLLYRAAFRNYSMAKEARKQQNDPEIKYESIIDEIEYSAMCIISATSCLESYINYIIGKYLPEESKVFDKSSSHRQKWLWVPAALNLPFRFKVTEPPYKLFSDLVRWRNDVIHHIPEFKAVKKYKSGSYKGNVSHTYSLFNVEHAKLAVEVVKNMISKLSEGEKIPLPRWFVFGPHYG
jgi:hypothetical protein